MFDFDEVIDRRGTHSNKWDSLEQLFGITDPDAIAMWVADMDFRAPPAVNEAIRALCDHGVHGYFGDYSDMKTAVVNWMATRHDWEVDPDWVGATHGLVSAIGLSLQALTEPGDGVVVFSPVYHAFGRVVRANGRELIESELRNVQGRYEMDLEALGQDLPTNARVVLFCSPHNPGGRVWTPEELRALAAFCAERDLILICDEVHHDLVYPEATHHVLANLAPEIHDRLITLTAPSKTFNIAGALTGNTIIRNPDFRKRIDQAAGAAGVGSKNRFGMTAATAAYQGGAPWLDALIPYLQDNRDRLAGAVAENLPGVRAMHLQSTYLAWLDFTALGLTPQDLLKKVHQDASIAVNAGPSFGKGGDGWLRFNFACPRATLDRAIDRLTDVFGQV